MGDSRRQQSPRHFRCGGMRRRLPGRDTVCIREGHVRFPLIYLGYPMEANHHYSEAEHAIRDGAQELDMVLNYPLLKLHEYDKVFADIAAVRDIAPPPLILKVILETSQLTPEDIIAGCKIAVAARADFVKTSTGFNGEGATEENVRLMKRVVSDRSGVKVKASGGVKTLRDCIRMIEAGANRIGTSSGVSIMEEARRMVENITHDVSENSNRSTTY